MLPRLLLTILALSLASPALADAVIYEGTLGAARIIVELSAPPETVSREVLLNAMKDQILDSAELKVVYDRTSIIHASAGGAPR